MPDKNEDKDNSTGGFWDTFFDVLTGLLVILSLGSCQ
jgi:hypothetical protein